MPSCAVTVTAKGVPAVAFAAAETRKWCSTPGWTPGTPTVLVSVQLPSATNWYCAVPLRCTSYAVDGACV